MKDFLSIKEFSKFTGIGQTTLRYWDDIGLFVPAKRDPDNNYRYYSPEQIIAVNFITVMSSLKVPLKTISEVGQKRDPELIIDMIEQQENILDMEMRRLRESYSIIHTRRELIKRGLRADESKISVQYRDEQPIILGPPTEFKGNEPFYEPFKRFCSAAREMRINLNYPIGGYHESVESFLNAPGKPDRFFSLDPTGYDKQAAGDYMLGFKRGYYGEINDLAERMKAYADEQSLALTGSVYIVYLHDETCVNDPSQYLAQACIAVARK